MALPPAFAESLFLKDGSIIEGEMAGENEKEIRVKRSDGIVSTIQRENIIRILMIDDYKKKVYIYKKDGSMVQAHVVEEDRKFYYLRTDLASPQEMKVPREEVKIISDVAVDTGEKGIKTYGWVSLSFAGLTIGGIVGGAVCQTEFATVKKDHSRLYKLYLLAGNPIAATYLHYQLADKKKLGDALSLGGNISYSLGLAFSAVSIITAAIFIYKYINFRTAQKRDENRQSFNPLDNVYSSVEVINQPAHRAAYHYCIGIVWRF